jgi:subtilisin family serine protease
MFSGLIAVGYRASVDSRTAANRIACFSQSSAYLALLAPGAVITAAGLSMTGTSQAAPHVAGAVAVLAARCPTAPIAQLETVLTGSGPSILDARNGVVNGGST